MKLVLFIPLFFVFFSNAQNKFDAKISESARQLSCPVPNERNPVTLNAQLVIEKDSIAVIVKASIAPGWHIYAYVPSNLPYIKMDHILELPDNVRAVGKWQNTRPTSSANDPGVLIYEQTAVFIQKTVRSSAARPGGVIKAGLYYQTCNLRQCLPPVEKKIELSFN